MRDRSVAVRRAEHAVVVVVHQAMHRLAELPGQARGRDATADRPVGVHPRVGIGDRAGDAAAVVPGQHIQLCRHERAEHRRRLVLPDLLDGLLDDFAPDQLVAANGHPMIFEAMKRARNRGVTTAFAVRGFGYYEPRYFTDVDHAFTCSRYLTDLYREKVGLTSTPIEPPIDWASVVAPTDSRAFVTFVNPAPHKGLLLFARLADMLGSRRPTFPSWSCSPVRAAGR